VIAACISLFSGEPNLGSKMETRWPTSLASPFPAPGGERSYSVLGHPSVLIALSVAAGQRAWVVVHRCCAPGLLRYTGIGKGSKEAIAFIVSVHVAVRGPLVLLQALWLDLSPSLCCPVLFGVALGLGLQGITKNFISGLIISSSADRSGDFVKSAHSRALSTDQPALPPKW